MRRTNGSSPSVDFARSSGKRQTNIWRHYSLHPQLALRAIRYANVRSGILPTQSRESGNPFALGFNVPRINMDPRLRGDDELSSNARERRTERVQPGFLLFPGERLSRFWRTDLRARHWTV